jgi:glycosyltransferase involved in cell wall biosynthesis
MDSELPIILQSLPVTRQLMRVVVVTETYPPEINGVAMTLGRMVAGLQARGHQVQLIRPKQSVTDTPASSDTFEEVLQRGVPIPRYDGLKMGLPAKAALTRLWTLRRPDIVHVATEGPLGWSALAAANKLRIPVSTDFHTNFHVYSKHYGFGWLRKPIINYLRKFHNKAMCTMVPTEGLKQELESEGYENLAVVQRGVDTALFTPEKRSDDLRHSWGVPSDGLVALYVGRLAPEKNLPVAIQAFEAIKRIRHDAKLVLVGDGPERAALEARYPGHVYAGMRTGDDLAAHYASADIFLFPSLSETYGNVTTEALASGLAVVAYDYAAAAELIRHGKTGMLAPLDDEKKFVAAAKALAGDPALTSSIGRRAREVALRTDWDKIFDHFEEVLLGVVNQGDSYASQTCVSLEQA